MTRTGNKRSTIYFDANLHKALRLKAAEAHRSLSDIVNEAVRLTLMEDREDLQAFEAREREPTISYAEMLEALKADGKI